MKFQLTKKEIVELAGKKEFPTEYKKELDTYLYHVRHNEESVWEWLEIEDCTPILERGEEEKC